MHNRYTFIIFQTVDISCDLLKMEKNKQTVCQDLQPKGEICQVKLVCLNLLVCIRKHISPRGYYECIAITYFKNSLLGDFKLKVGMYRLKCQQTGLKPHGIPRVAYDEPRGGTIKVQSSKASDMYLLWLQMHDRYFGKARGDSSIPMCSKVNQTNPTPSHT